MKYAWYCSEDHGDIETSFIDGGWRKNRSSFKNAFNQATQALFRRYKRWNAQGNLGHVPIEDLKWTKVRWDMKKEVLDVKAIEDLVRQTGTCKITPVKPDGERVQGWIEISTMEHLEKDQQWMIDQMKKDAQEYANKDNKPVTITNCGGLGSVTAYPNEPTNLKHVRSKRPKKST